MQEESLLYKYCTNNCSQEERAQVDLMINSSDEVAQEVALIRKSLLLADGLKEIRNTDVHSAWGRLQYKLEHENKPVVKVRLSPWKMAQRIAAILTIPLLMSTLLLTYRLTEKQGDAQMVEIQANQGTHIKYELPDNSVVWLNAESKLTFPTTFNPDRREVYLSGEAYFEVYSDKEHPFYVHTNEGISVYVYGTKFNVETYPESNRIKTVLQEGRVNVLMTKEKKSYKMSPGESFTYKKDSGEIAVSHVDPYVATAWKDGKLIFRDDNLEEIFAELERHFDVKIIYKNLSDRDPRYRATFTGEGLDDILTYLAQSAHLEWHYLSPLQKKDGTFDKKQIAITLNK